MQINLRFIFRLSPFVAKLARSLVQGSTNLVLTKHFQLNGMSLRSFSSDSSIRKHRRAQKPVMPWRLGFQGEIQLQGMFLSPPIMAKSSM